MAVVSVRVDDQTLDVLKSHKANVSEIARRALAHEAKRLRALEAVERLSGLHLPLQGPSSTEVVRRSRDERYARN